MKHTPGPWRKNIFAGDKYPPHPSAEIWGTNEAGTHAVKIAKLENTSHGEDCILGNASLIAASWELLEALRAAQAVLVEVQSISHHHPVYVQMANAIAKATEQR